MGAKTLKHHVKPVHLQKIEVGTFSFCPTPACGIVYFNASGVVLEKADVREPIAVKESDPDLPQCYCFGYTTGMVLSEFRRTGRWEIPRRIAAEVKAGNCACDVRNPQGSCCLGTIAELMRATASYRARGSVPKQFVAGAGPTLEVL